MNVNLRSLIALFPIIFLASSMVEAQESEPTVSDILRSFYSNALEQEQAYKWLKDLCAIGPRLSGSKESYEAVEWAVTELEALGLDSVWTEEMDVPHWVRGEERAVLTATGHELHVTALGGSTGSLGWVTGKVVEVKSWDELDALGHEGVNGNIVLFNRPMDPTLMETGMTYGRAVDQRGIGSSRAARYGAVGVLVRSVTTRHDDFPHAGAMRYIDSLPKIPALGISTNDADFLSEQLTEGETELKMFLTCHWRPDTIGYNVIGEIKGSTYPDEIMVVGGHLDSWDLAEGPQDDGAGCVQSMEVLKQFVDLGIKPKCTLRVVLFANEENGLKGAVAYANGAKERAEVHILGIESDGGGYTPQGYRIQGNDEQVEYIRQFRELFEPYGMYKFVKSGSGTDIGRLKTEDNILLGLHVDGTRYFDVHHTADDLFIHVNPRELEMGTAAMSSMIYIIDQKGIGKKE